MSDPNQLFVLKSREEKISWKLLRGLVFDLNLSLKSFKSRNGADLFATDLPIYNKHGTHEIWG